MSDPAGRFGILARVGVGCQFMGPPPDTKVVLSVQKTCFQVVFDNREIGIWMKSSQEASRRPGRWLNTPQITNIRRI